ncbi:MAG: TonB family protein [Bryobacterales bacterium]|nr:TonB family protein [Bryobacterales bacterium]
MVDVGDGLRTHLDPKAVGSVGRVSGDDVIRNLVASTLVDADPVERSAVGVSPDTLQDRGWIGNTAWLQRAQPRRRDLVGVHFQRNRRSAWCLMGVMGIFGGWGQAGGTSGARPGSYQPPKVIERQQPEYTIGALEAEVEGRVVLETTVAVDGTASNIKVVRGLSFGLDEKAVECLQKWRFVPATRDGVQTPVRATVEIAFRLPTV